MARTRRRFSRKRTFRRRGVRRRRVLFRKRSRRRVGFRKRTFRRRTGFRRRTRMRGRVGARKLNVFAPFEAKKRRKRLFLKTLVNTGDAVVIDQNTVAATVHTRNNPLGIVQLPYLGESVACPDVFPPTGTAGTLIIFNLYAYMRAMVASFVDYRGSVIATDVQLSKDSFGFDGINSPDELLLRRYIKTHKLCCLRRIQLNIIRRVGRSTNNTTVHGSTQLPAGQLTLDGTFTTQGGLIHLTNVNPVNSNPTNNVTQYVNNTNGELPFYANTLSEGFTIDDFIVRSQSGFPRPGGLADYVTGEGAIPMKTRISRMLNEMQTGKEFKKMSAMSNLSFSLNLRNGSSDYFMVKWTSLGGATVIPVNHSTNDAGWHTDSSFVDCDIANASELGVGLAGGLSNNFCTAPAFNGPRGTVIVWAPYSFAMFSSLYDIEVKGFYEFANPSVGVVDWSALGPGNSN